MWPRKREIFSIAHEILALSRLEQGWALESRIVEFKGLRYKVLEDKDHTLIMIIKINNNS